VVPDPYSPHEPATGWLCKRHLWWHKWTRWQREEVITPIHGEVVFWQYRSCLRCGWSQSKSDVVARGANSFPRHLKV
jgi:hypothetical protein